MAIIMEIMLMIILFTLHPSPDADPSIIEAFATVVGTAAHQNSNIPTLPEAAKGKTPSVLRTKTLPLADNYGAPSGVFCLRNTVTSKSESFKLLILTAAAMAARR